MAKIFKFQNKNDENCFCETCQLIDEYTYIGMECSNIEELKEVFREIYLAAYKHDYIESVQEDLHLKIHILEDLEKELNE